MLAIHVNVANIGDFGVKKTCILYNQVDTTSKKLFRKIVLLFSDILYFQVNHMSFGEVQTVDLIPDGSNIRVLMTTSRHT